MVRINNIKIYNNFSEEELINFVIKKYKISEKDIKKWNIVKKSVDARKKDDVHFSYSIDFDLNNENKYLKNKDIIKIEANKIPNININLNKSIQPVIIGSGPAGLFAALTFVRYGYKPIIIEQGQSVDERQKTVDNFKKTGILNVN